MRSRSTGSRRRRRRSRGALLLGVLLCGGLGWVVWALRVDEVRVVGAQSISANEVVDAAAIGSHERILWMRTSVVARRLAALPGVAGAIVERRLPTTIVIRVREREPVVRLDGHPALVADGEGAIFGARGEAALPVLAGWSGVPELGSNLRAPAPGVLAALDTFPADLRARITRIALQPSLTVVLDDGTEVRFGRPTDLAAKAAAAQAVLEAAADRAAELEYVDVRSPRVPASRRREPPTPEPTPEATPGQPPPVPPATPAPEPVPEEPEADPEP